MNIIVFDTETTSLEKPFCYNIGIVGYDTENARELFRRDWVVQQIWHNAELFTTAYYADKREIYIRNMRARKTTLEKFGYVTQEIFRLCKKHEIERTFAYNSPFDDKVFTYNCDWFKCINPLDNLPIIDIRGFAHEFIAQTEEYKQFCEANELFTETGNYSTTAENVYRFFVGMDFVEEHTALSDSLIELEILKKCVERGAEWNKEYKVLRTIERPTLKHLEVYDKKNNESFHFDYYKRVNREQGNKIILS